MSNTSTTAGINPSTCQEGDRHCESPIETNLFNVFHRPADDDDETIVETDNTTVDNGCYVAESNDNGSYGIVKNGESNENSDGILLQQLEDIVIAFQYQIQTSLSISAFQSSDSSPLVMIEKAISDVLVQNFFSNPLCTPSGTKESRKGNTRRRLRSTTGAWIRQERRRMQIETSETGWTGLTTNPKDSILPGIAGVTCHTKLVKDATSCFTVGGAFTATTTMGANATWIESLSKLAIRDAMNQQQLLNQIHDQVYDVSYISDNPGTFIPEPPQGQEIIQPLVPTLSPVPNSSEVSRGGVFVIWPWIFIPLGAVVLCIIIYEFYRHVQRRRIMRGNSIIDDSSRPQPISGNRSSLFERQRSTVTIVEYGQFCGSFPNTNRLNVPSGPYFVEEYDSNDVSDDAYPTNNKQQHYDLNENLTDENMPIFILDGVDMNNKSYDTELYHNSVASSSDNGSSYETKGLSGTRGHFPSHIT